MFFGCIKNAHFAIENKSHGQTLHKVFKLKTPPQIISFFAKNKNLIP